MITTRLLIPHDNGDSNNILESVSFKEPLVPPNMMPSKETKEPKKEVQLKCIETEKSFLTVAYLLRFVGKPHSHPLSSAGRSEVR